MSCKIGISVLLCLFLASIAWGDQIIIDNGDNATSFVGDWKVSGAESYYGDDSIYCKKANATYTFEATVNGTRGIALWWTEWPSRSASVPVEIYDGNTLLDTIQVNQTAQGGQWNVLGTYNFAETARVTIVSESNSHSTCADAARFTDVVDIIVRTVLVEWDYDDAAEADEAGFTIRVNDGTIIDVSDPDQRSWTGNVNLVPGVNKFDMQTYDVGGNYSTWSDPTYYTPEQEIVILAPTDVTVIEAPQ